MRKYSLLVMLASWVSIILNVGLILKQKWDIFLVLPLEFGMFALIVWLKLLYNEQYNKNLCTVVLSECGGTMDRMIDSITYRETKLIKQRKNIEILIAFALILMVLIMIQSSGVLLF